jgi:predicted dehydrogenase
MKTPDHTIPTLPRRAFLQQSAAAAVALPYLASARAFAANDKVVVGVMGVGGRGSFLAQSFAKRPDVEVAYVSDPDSRRLAQAAKIVETEQKRAPSQAQDFRRVLEDKNVDAMINATPDHWHVLGSILACQAGKDVYVEKPMSHNLWEGRQLVEAARKHGRVVQVGMQSRSAPYMQKALEVVKSGRLGEIYLVRVFNMMQHGLSRPTNQAVPAGVDYELWCGPAAKSPEYLGYRWLNLYEYSCGPIPGDLVHQLDLARMLTGDLPAPKSVSATGALYVLKDGRDTPDTQLATFDYGDFTLQFDAALWTPYMKKTPGEKRDKDILPNWPFNSTRIELFGSKSFMYVGRHGDGWQVFDADAKAIETSTGRQGDKEHIENFLQCIRSRAKPAANAEQGHYSAMLCHLANASCRAGNRRLAFDAQAEIFPNEPAANRFLKRPAYRQPWVVPAYV